MLKQRVFSGIQPSGVPHLGNYIGALQQWVKLQDTHDAIFCIVDYHTITVRQDPEELTNNIYNLAAIYLAVGLDPNKAILFRQSDVSAHTELAWILSTMTYMGELERMTQYKDKAKQHKTNNNAGLFTYPALMAADILLYQTNLVPVGEDQKQHIELTRDLAERFNQQYGETFTVPEVMHPKQGARIMSLDDPTKKMSKSATSEWGYISLLDSPDSVLKKIKKAVTDSGSEVKSSKDKPALTNLLTIYSCVTGKTIHDIETLYAGQGYGKFKQDLAKAIITFLEPIQAGYAELINDRTVLKNILQLGKTKAELIANKTLLDVKQKLGL
ncbi:MAG: tryptophan--tRNA ligase [Patescibacteria group bacterium]|jgi:tryptophanyl-tRNA synthetase